RVAEHRRERQDVLARRRRSVEGHLPGHRDDAHAAGPAAQRLLSAAGRPSAGLLITGSELLLGLVADRNTSFLAQALDRLGVDLERVLVVGDGEDAIVEGLETLRRHD